MKKAFKFKLIITFLLLIIIGGTTFAILNMYDLLPEQIKSYIPNYGKIISINNKIESVGNNNINSKNNSGIGMKFLNNNINLQGNMDFKLILENIYDENDGTKKSGEEIINGSIKGFKYYVGDYSLEQIFGFDGLILNSIGTDSLKKLNSLENLENNIDKSMYGFGMKNFSIVGKDEVFFIKGIVDKFENGTNKCENKDIVTCILDELGVGNNSKISGMLNDFNSGKTIKIDTFDQFRSLFPKFSQDENVSNFFKAFYTPNPFYYIYKNGVFKEIDSLFQKGMYKILFEESKSGENNYLKIKDSICEIGQSQENGLFSTMCKQYVSTLNVFIGEDLKLITDSEFDSLQYNSDSIKFFLKYGNGQIVELKSEFSYGIGSFDYSNKKLKINFPFEPAKLLGAQVNLNGDIDFSDKPTGNIDFLYSGEDGKITINYEVDKGNIKKLDGYVNVENTSLNGDISKIKGDYSFTNKIFNLGYQFFLGDVINYSGSDIKSEGNSNPAQKILDLNINYKDNNLKINLNIQDDRLITFDGIFKDYYLEFTLAGIDKASSINYEQFGKIGFENGEFIFVSEGKTTNSDLISFKSDIKGGKILLNFVYKNTNNNILFNIDGIINEKEHNLTISIDVSNDLFGKEKFFIKLKNIFENKDGKMFFNGDITYYIDELDEKNKLISFIFNGDYDLGKINYELPIDFIQYDFNDFFESINILSDSIGENKSLEK